MKIVKQITTGKILYRSSPDFETGKGILNARTLNPNIPVTDMKEDVISPAEIAEEQRLSALSGIRTKRNTLLAECDWTQTLDAPLTPEQLTAWAEYRQALRDFPEIVDVNNPVWPKKPA